MVHVPLSRQKHINSIITLATHYILFFFLLLFKLFWVGFSLKKVNALSVVPDVNPKHARIILKFFHKIKHVRNRWKNDILTANQAAFCWLDKHIKNLPICLLTAHISIKHWQLYCRLVVYWPCSTKMDVVHWLSILLY